MAKFKVGDRVKRSDGRIGTVIEVGGVLGDYLVKVDGGLKASWDEDDVTIANSRACNAAYSGTLKDIMDSVKPYMDKRIKGDEAWKYPMLVITVLRRVCDRATMSAGRYDGQRPPHRIYNIECVKDGFKFQGNLIVTGLFYRADPDDVSAFDEYDMTMSLMNVGKASNTRACNAKLKVGDQVYDVIHQQVAKVVKIDDESSPTSECALSTGKTVSAYSAIPLSQLKYKVGQTVKVKSAPFEGMSGIIVGYQGNSYSMTFGVKIDGLRETVFLKGNDIAANARACNAITASDEKKLCDVMRRYLNKPGDKIVAKVHEGLPNGMSRTTIEVCAAYHDDDRESPHNRIKAATKAVMDSLTIPCVGDGTRTMNDGSVAGNLIFMNSRSINSRVCNSRNPIVRKAMNARAVRNSVTQIEVTDLKTGEKRVLDIGELKAHHYGLGKELSDYELFLLGDKALLRAKSPTHQYRVVNESVRNASDAEIDQHLLIKSDSRYPGEDGKTTVKFSRLPESVKEDMRENYDILKSGRVSVFSSRFNGHNWAVTLV